MKPILALTFAILTAAACSHAKTKNSDITPPDTSDKVPEVPLPQVPLTQPERLSEVQIQATGTMKYIATDMNDGTYKVLISGALPTWQVTNGITIKDDILVAHSDPQVPKEGCTKVSALISLTSDGKSLYHLMADGNETCRSGLEKLTSITFQADNVKSLNAKVVMGKLSVTVNKS